MVHVEKTLVESGNYWSLGLFAAAVVGLVVGTIAVAYLLGQRHAERATGVPFESGIPPTGSARLRFFAEFYLIAMFAVIFDLESVFIFAWAVAVRELGWAGYAEVLIFSGVLLAALAYLWRAGALNLGNPGRAPAMRYAERQAMDDAAAR